MNILHIASSVGRQSFGIGPVVLNISVSQQSQGAFSNIFCCDRVLDAKQLETEYAMRAETIHTFKFFGPRRLSYSPSMEHAISQRGNSFSVLHQHGIWTAVSRATCRWRSLTGRPTVIAPQGSLDSWALKQSAWKKKIALHFYEFKNLQRASCIHALSPDEADAFRHFGLSNPIAIIPNGISDMWLESKSNYAGFRRRFDLSSESYALLFLGRITPKKGIPMLVRAIAAQKPYLGAFKLIIAGVDEFGHQREVQQLVNQLSLEAYVEFSGPMYGQLKRDAYAASDLFVLPSYSEGAPNTILEALGAGVPVLTTKASPWEDLIRHKCGWWTEIREDAIGVALRDALQTPREELREMGRRGKALVSTKYTWTEVAKKTLSLYNWLLGEAERPDFVYLD